MAPAANSKGASKDDSSGLIRFEINNISDVDSTRIYSPVIEVHGTPWKLWACKSGSPLYLNVYICQRESDCDIWSYDVSAEFSLININAEKNVLRKFKKTFNYEQRSLGYREYIKWEDVINEEKGFLNDGKIIIEARVTLSNVVGIRVAPRIDFTDASDPRHDVALVIDGEKIHVNKGILAIHSPVFNSMFYGQFVEKDKNEIELKDIGHKEFVVLLRLIYPSDEKITDSNVKYILKLADQFQMKNVLDQVERYLLDSTTVNMTSKIDLSDKFRLVNLQDHCLDSLKTVKDIQNLKATDGYKGLSDKIKATLLEKVMKLT